LIGVCFHGRLFAGTLAGRWTVTRLTATALFLAAVLAGCDSNLLDRDEDVSDDLRAEIAFLRARVEQLETASADHEAKLEKVTVVGDDFIFTGLNVHVRSGSGWTDGTVNGLGNLIVGYNETRSSDNERTGSHNILVGREHNFTSYGGLAAGRRHTITDQYACACGGYNSTASGEYATVSGGISNIASGWGSAVSSGFENNATLDMASVSGGWNNDASGQYSSVSGGSRNTASGRGSSVSGGYDNTVVAQYASVSGGDSNAADGDYSSVSGGRLGTASGDNSSISGGYNNTASGECSHVCGGNSNTASAAYSIAP